MSVTSSVGRIRSGGWGLAAVVLAVGQPVTTWVFDRLSPVSLTSGPMTSPLVPPGAWFSIWALILLLSLLWSSVHFRHRRDAGVDGMARGFTIAFAGFSLWLAAAAFGQSGVLTLPPFAVILGGLVLAERARGSRRATVRGPDRLLDVALIGIYGAWASVALWVDIATVAQAGRGPLPTWQDVLLLVAACGTVVVGLVLTRGSAPYALTAVYAFVGVVISTGVAGLPVLVTVGGTAIGVVVAACLVVRRQRPAGPAPRAPRRSVVLPS